MPSSPPSIPSIRIGERLGEGMTGTVYAAVNANGDELAVKVLHESLADEPGMVARFRREAENAERLRSEFIAVGGAPDAGGPARKRGELPAYLEGGRYDFRTPPSWCWRRGR